MKIEGCTALVTGANRGIGLGFVEELLAEGAAHIYAAARSAEDAATLSAMGDGRVTGIVLDVTRPEQVAAAAGACTGVSLLVNNAGAFNRHTLMRAPDMGSMRQEMEVNFFGLVAMCRAFAHILGANGGGAIVNVLSAGAIVPVPEMGGYSPSKFAARAAGDCIRAELAGQGTAVTSLIVGSVDTRMAEHVKGVDKASPRDIARAGLLAVRHGLEEHDTDRHAVEVRAFLARDPHRLRLSMVQRMAKLQARWQAEGAGK